MPLPKLPNPENALSVFDKLDSAIDKGLGFIDKASDRLDKLGVTEEPPTTTPQNEQTAVERGTACTLCSEEHLSEVSGALSEALRFARNEGMGSREAIRRVRHARDELNAMERFDLAPEEMVKLPPDEQKIAHWALPQSRDLRHILNSMQSVDDLEQAAARAANVADEFAQKLIKCKPGYETKPEEIELPPEIEALKKLVEERKGR
ncbi:hypothetical protein ES705_44149 [subsurface metagenome]